MWQYRDTYKQERTYVEGRMDRGMKSIEDPGGWQGWEGARLSTCSSLRVKVVWRDVGMVSHQGVACMWEIEDGGGDAADGGDDDWSQE